MPVTDAPVEQHSYLWKRRQCSLGPRNPLLLGTEETRRFYTLPVVLVGGINKGGLGWLEEHFNQVAWTELDGALHSKPDMYQLWLSKQCIGICATGRNLARIQDILDNKCPKCGQARETSTHLNRCSDHGPQLVIQGGCCEAFYMDASKRSY